MKEPGSSFLQSNLFHSFLLDNEEQKETKDNWNTVTEDKWSHYPSLRIPLSTFVHSETLVSVARSSSFPASNRCTRVAAYQRVTHLATLSWHAKGDFRVGILDSERALIYRQVWPKPWILINLVGILWSIVNWGEKVKVTWLSSETTFRISCQKLQWWVLHRYFAIEKMLRLSFSWTLGSFFLADKVINVFVSKSELVKQVHK